MEVLSVAYVVRSTCLHAELCLAWARRGRGLQMGMPKKCDREFSVTCVVLHNVHFIELYDSIVCFFETLKRIIRHFETDTLPCLTSISSSNRTCSLVAIAATELITYTLSHSHSLCLTENIKHRFCLDFHFNSFLIAICFSANPTACVICGVWEAAAADVMCL